MGIFTPAPEKSLMGVEAIYPLSEYRHVIMDNLREAMGVAGAGGEEMEVTSVPPAAVREIEAVEGEPDLPPHYMEQRASENITEEPHATQVRS